MKNKLEIVQYIVLRKDLGMSIGKACAQVAHASVCTVVGNTTDPWVKEWLRNNSFTKIVLSAKSSEAITNLAFVLTNSEIKHKIIVDNCLTELTPETNDGTITCIGVIPMPKAIIRPYLERFRLY